MKLALNDIQQNIRYDRWLSSAWIFQAKFHCM